MTKQHPRCPICNHLESLHKYKAGYKTCQMCKCRVSTASETKSDEADEKDAEYWANLDR